MSLSGPSSVWALFEVVGELGGVLIGVLAVERLERLADPRVEAHPPCERELVGQGVLDQGVGEAGSGRSSAG